MVEEYYSLSTSVVIMLLYRFTCIVKPRFYQGQNIGIIIIILYSVWDPGPRTGTGYGSGPNYANCYIQECDEFHSFGRIL